LSQGVDDPCSLVCIRARLYREHLLTSPRRRLCGPLNTDANPEEELLGSTRPPQRVVQPIQAGAQVDVQMSEAIAEDSLAQVRASAPHRQSTRRLPASESNDATGEGDGHQVSSRGCARCRAWFSHVLGSWWRGFRAISALWRANGSAAALKRDASEDLPLIDEEHDRRGCRRRAAGPVGRAGHPRH
jgi:hypothetical protein